MSTIKIENPSYLMICLHKSSNTPFCSECNSIPLIDIIQGDIRCLLHYKDNNGNIKPIRPDMFNKENQYVISSTGNIIGEVRDH